MHFHGGRARRKLPLVVTQQHLVGPTDGVGCKEDQHLFRGCRQSWLWGIEAAPACDAGGVDREGCGLAGGGAGVGLQRLDFASHAYVIDRQRPLTSLLQFLGGGEEGVC